MDTPPPILDHLVLIVPSISPDSLAFYEEAGFDIIQGGTHADGLTQNALICLPNGVYLELLAFVPGTSPELKAAHWWGQKKFGWGDWSISPSPLTTADRYSSLSLSTTYDPPAPGGRRTLDGKDLRWVIGFPKVDRGKGEYRGRMPFWCEDVTEREWRVPTPPQGSHGNGAKGIESITLLAGRGEGDLEKYLAALGKVLPKAPEGEGHLFELGVLKQRANGDLVKVFVRQAVSKEEEDWVAERGEGLWSIKILVGGGGKGTIFGAGEGARMVL